MSANVVWRAEVTALAAHGQVWVKAPKFMGEEQVGPVRVHGTCLVGDRVLLIILGGTALDMVVLPDWEARLVALENRVTVLEG